jgi:putative oxidoreductase
MTITTSAVNANGAVALVSRVIGWFEVIPYWLIAIACRIALAQVFWGSAQTHLTNWQTTLYLFDSDYSLPFLPSEPAAYLAVTIELVVPVLLVLGLATRFATLVIFGMTLVIEVFVYPQAWPTHIQWVAMMLVLMAYGAGPLSLDGLIRRWAGAGAGRTSRQ